MIRLAVAAGLLAAALSTADARPVWRSVPTPLPPVVHTAKVRPPHLGPVWRIAPVIPVTDVVEYVAPAVEASPAPVADAAPVVEAPRASLPAPAVVVAVANIAPAVEAAQPAAAAFAAPPKPAPVVVAEKAPAAPPVAPAKPAATPPVSVAAPAVVETAPGIPWLDYLGVIALAAIVGGTIFFVARERRRPASRAAS